MASFIQTLYNNSPLSLQNCFVSLRGLNFVRKRYGKVYNDTLNFLMRSQWYSSDEFRMYQQEQLNNLLLNAKNNTNYYRGVLEKYVAGSFSLEDLSELPFLDKKLLRENTADFTDKSWEKYGYLEGHTSGTSGAPMVWNYDLHSMQWAMALRARQYRWGGVSERDLSARFSGNVIMGKSNLSPFWRHNKSENQYLFSTYHLTQNNIELYYKALMDFNFRFLDGYPSAFFTIARWINQNDLSGKWRPWMINTTAETLTDYYRAEIETAFGCKIFNHYSSSEGAPFVTQCPAGNMHLNPESGIIEFLRSDGNPADLGEEAELVVTSFFQKSLPIIRYRIGDIGALAEEQYCPCGRKMPVVKYIGGRESDTIYTSERGRTGSAGISTVFYSIPSRMKSSQLEQIDKDKFIFRYVKLDSCLTEPEKKVVIERFQDRLGKSVEIQVEVVEEIKPGANGKIRLIVGLKEKLND